MSDSYISASLRKLVIKRAKGNCEYCLLLSNFSANPFCIDHIEPISKGGLSVETNLAYSCLHCNGSKYNKTEGFDIISQKTVPLFNPRKTEWENYFSWNKDFTIIVGMNSVGRATVETLKMNEKRVQNLRKALHAFGVFPPS